MAWLRYGLDGKVTKSQRDAAIMRERFSHDDELAAHIEREVTSRGGGKLVVIPGYAHAVMPGGITDRIGHRLHTEPKVVAVFRDDVEDAGFHTFLWQQSRLLAIDLSRPLPITTRYRPVRYARMLRLGRYVALDGSREREHSGDLLPDRSFR